MQYHSTRDHSEKATAARAIARGLAPGGGLYVPESLPALPKDELALLAGMDYRGRAAAVMKKFLDEFTISELTRFASKAYSANYDHPEIAPVHMLGYGTGVLELWHGPTCAFKDMALQMLPRLLTASLKKTGETREVCILVATSGDTGKAALEGFKDVKGTRILVFYPAEGVSQVQKLQMTTQKGKNVFVCAVAGNFDDAQTGVKKIFGDAAFADRANEKGFFLSSANSINWGRLLPQIVYYISAYLDFVKSGGVRMGEKVNFCVPTGNFGNILAGWYAKRMGLPVRRFICASNENNVLTEFIETGVYDKNRPFVATASPSMDILVSSNLERLLFSLSGSDAKTADYMARLAEFGKYEITDDMFNALTAEFSAGYCDDIQTAAAIEKVWREHAYLMDTHTAVGWHVLTDYKKRTGDNTPCVLVSTASPFKFCDSVLSALGGDADLPGAALIEKLAGLTGVPAPAPLRGLGGRPERFTGRVEKSGMLKVVEGFLSRP